MQNNGKTQHERPPSVSVAIPCPTPDGPALIWVKLGGRENGARGVIGSVDCERGPADSLVLMETADWVRDVILLLVRRQRRVER